MPSSEYSHPYTSHGAPSSYTTQANRGWGPPQTGPSTSRYAIYNNPAWKRENDASARTRERDTTQQTQDDRDSAALDMQEELDLAQAIANSTHTAEREARRRRREADLSDRRQTSIYIQQLGPAYSNSSASSTRSRPARPHLEEPPTQSNASFRARRYVRHPNAFPAEKLFEYDTMFTADFRCPRCGQLIVTSQVRLQRYSPAVISLLHLKCSSCSSVYCRGCALRTDCSSRCTGGDHCPLVKCCQPVGAVAVFEALSDLDTAYTTEAATLANSSPPSRPQREEYLELAISRADPKLSETFDRTFLHALTEVNFWISEKREVSNVHPSVAMLFSSSYIFEIVYHYLIQPKAGDWVIRAEVYLQILILVTTLAARNGLNHLVMQPRNIKQMCGLHNIIWTKGKILWEEGLEGTLPPLYTIITQLNDCSQALLKLQESMRSSQLRQKAWSLQRQIHILKLNQVCGPDC